MLPKENRLKKMKDFQIVFEKGFFVPGKLINLKIWKIDEEVFPKRGYIKTDLKIGFSVGLKVSKSAVKRNRIKRQLREIVRLLLKEERLKKSFFVVVIVKPEILDKDYKEIEKSVLTVFKKARLLK